MVKAMNVQAQDFYSTGEAASLLGVSSRLVRQWIYERKMRGAEKHRDRKWRIPQSEISRMKVGRAGELVDTEERTSFDYQVTLWAKKEALSFAADQLERYNIPYVWTCRDGKWAIFRTFVGRIDIALGKERADQIESSGSPGA